MSGQLLIRSRGEISSLLFLFCLPDSSLTSGATTGVYTVWLRDYAPNGAGDSVYISLDPEGQPAATVTGFAPQAWHWTNVNAQGGLATIKVTKPGLYTLHLWQREDGLRLDRILLTTNGGYTPTGNGPPESKFE